MRQNCTLIVIIEVSGLSGLEVMLKSLFTNGKVVESQVPGERWREFCFAKLKMSALPEVPGYLLGRSFSPSLLAELLRLDAALLASPRSPGSSCPATLAGNHGKPSRHRLML